MKPAKSASVCKYANDEPTAAMSSAAGVEFTNGDQPGVRLAKAAAAHSLEPARTSNPTVAAKAARRKTAKATKKKQ